MIIKKKIIFATNITPMENVINIIVLKAHIIYICASYAAVIIAIVVDLFSAYVSCKRYNIPWYSSALRRSLSKTQKYITPLLVLTLIDILSTPLINYPWLTITYAILICLIEFVSVFEKSNNKQDKEKINIILNIMNEQKDIKNILMNLLKNYYDKKNKQRGISENS